MKTMATMTEWRERNIENEEMETTNAYGRLTLESKFVMTRVNDARFIAIGVHGLHYTERIADALARVNTNAANCERCVV